MSSKVQWSKWVLVALALAIATPLTAQEKPRIAVLEFEAKADNQWYQWWRGGGASAAQDVFVTELVKSGKFRVVERSQLQALLAEQNLSLSGAVDGATAVQAGRLLGVRYLLTGAITEYGTSTAGANTRGIGGLPSVRVGRKKFAAALNARLIDTESGEIVWADEGREETKSGNVNVGGFGGGVDDDAMFDRVLKPVVQHLVASLKAADL
ncbi:MAG TPA: CsgG/HfaB family protein [Thermoanaerobaculia bacterium]|nr:CsgG/HfaB family protein [Thermoanaerobaculia bacterium]